MRSLYTWLILGSCILMFFNSCCKNKYAASILFTRDFKNDSIQLFKGKEFVMDSVISTNYSVDRAIQVSVLSCDSFVLKINVGNKTFKEIINKEKGVIFLDVSKKNDSVKVVRFDTIPKTHRYVL